MYEVLSTRLSGLGDVYLALRRGEGIEAQRMWRRHELDMRLLDDLGWQREAELDRVRLTMPTETLRPVIEGIYWESVSALAQQEDDLIAEAQEQLKVVVALCSSLLALMAQADASAGGQRVRPAEVAGVAERVAQLAEGIKRADIS